MALEAIEQSAFENLFSVGPRYTMVIDVFIGLFNLKFCGFVALILPPVLRPVNRGK
jgi:hypothetical protein